MQHCQSIGILTVGRVQHSVRIMRPGQLVFPVVMVMVILVVVLFIWTGCIHTVDGALVHRPNHFFLFVLEALLPSEIASVLKHVTRIGMERPKRTLTRLVRSPGHFDKAIVEAKRMPD